MWKSKLFWRLLAVYTVLILTAGTILVIWFANQQRESVYDQLRGNLQTAAIILDRDAAAVLRNGAAGEVQAEWMRYEAETGIRLTLIRNTGEVLADSSRPPETMDNHINRPEIQMAREAGLGWAERTSSTIEVPMLYHARRILDDDEILGFARTAMPMSAVKNRIRSLQAIVTGLGLALTAAALLATWWIVMRIVPPLQEMTRVAERIAAGHFDEGTSIETGDELETLGDALNHMSRQLRQRLEQLDEQNRTILESSERLRTVLGSMIEGVVAVDERQRLLFANRTAMNMFDLGARDLQDRPLVEVIRHPRVLEVVAEVLTERRFMTVEIELPRKELAVSLIASRLPGEPTGGVVMVLHDISDLRRLENLRREFVSNVSHELKTPLASIQAYTETLLEGAIDDPKINRSFLERIAQQSERLHMLILDMLKIAKVESGQEVFDLTAVPLKELLLDCLLEHETLAEAKTISLMYEPPPAPDDVAVHADMDGLRTIIDNLLDNAVKYTPDGGRVSVAWVLQGDRVVLSVSDTGVGIPSEHHTRIFERFYRVDKARSREMGGTGLGLSIVKHLVQVFGGKISVQSEAGKGSTFQIELRRA